MLDDITEYDSYGADDLAIDETFNLAEQKVIAMILLWIEVNESSDVMIFEKWGSDENWEECGKNYFQQMQAW